MDAIKLLSKLVSINSVFPNEYKLAVFLEDYLKNIGFITKRQYIDKNRFNVLGEKGKENWKSILFYGHMDTVPSYWELDSNPFKLREEGDRLYGLGTWDMKCGLAAILKALETVNIDKKIKVAFTCDEENISKGAYTLVRSRFLDNVECIFVTESGLNDKGISGPQMITLGRRGRAVYSFTVTGKSSHGADVNRGINAITEASKLVIELDSMNKNFRKHGLLPHPTQFINKVFAESTSLSTPFKAYLELDRHLVPPETPESVLREIKNHTLKLSKDGLLKAKVEIRIKPRETPYLAPYLTPTNHKFVKILSNIVKRKFGKVIYNYGLSVADENVLATKRHVVTIGTKGANEHAANEWVSKQSYFNLVSILADLITYYNHQKLTNPKPINIDE